MAGRYLQLTVTQELAGRTLDTLLRRELFLSGTLVKRVKAMPGGLLLDGAQAAVTLRVREGQILAVNIADPDAGEIFPAQGPLEIVHEDEDLLILNKAAGVAVHPGPGHFDNTIGNYLAYYYKTKGVTAGFHPVNRLDRGTSGLMTVAKHAHAQERLRSQLHTGAFRRRYLAVCRGVPKPATGIVDAPIGRADGSALRREVRPDGREAVTRYEVLEEHAGRSLVRLELETGRTHQIRVHMSYLGHPLVGDFLYGEEEPNLISRAALHSHMLSLRHPVTGAKLCLTAPLPGDMAALLKD